MPGVQDGLLSSNATKLKRKAGPAPYAEDDLLPPLGKKPKYQQLKNASSLGDAFTIKVRTCEPS